MWGLKLWQEILLWIVIFIDLYVFVKLSQLRVDKLPVISLHWRILIAVLFPLIFVMAFVFGMVLLAFVLTILFIIFLFSLFRRKRRNGAIKIRLF